MEQEEGPGPGKRKPDALVLCEGRDNLHGYTCRVGKRGREVECGQPYIKGTPYNIPSIII